MEPATRNGSRGALTLAMAGEKGMMCSIFSTVQPSCNHHSVRGCRRMVVCQKSWGIRAIVNAIPG